MNTIEGSISRKMSAAKQHEEWRHAVSKTRRAVIKVIMIEDRNASNILVEFKRLKTVSYWRGTLETKNFDSTLSKRAVSVEPLIHMTCILYTGTGKAFVYCVQLGGGKKCLGQHKASNFGEAHSAREEMIFPVTILS